MWRCHFAQALFGAANLGFVDRLYVHVASNSFGGPRSAPAAKKGFFCFFDLCMCRPSVITHKLRLIIVLGPGRPRAGRVSGSDFGQILFGKTSGSALWPAEDLPESRF